MRRSVARAGRGRLFNDFIPQGEIYDSACAGESVGLARDGDLGFAGAHCVRLPAVTASQPAKAVTAQRLPMYATLLGCDGVTPSAQ